MKRPLPSLLFIFMAAALLAGCDGRSEGPIQIAFIGQPEALPAEGMRLSPVAQQVRAATAAGLVTFDESGDIVPAVAERWIVTDDARSYIFRLRDSDWPDGTPLTGENVRDALRRNIAALEGTSLGLDLAKIEEIRAMTGRVVEIRLSSPMPGFLRLLAQPEMGLLRSGEGAGPMVDADPEDRVAQLTALPPEDRGLPAIEDWGKHVRPVFVRAMPARPALAAFGQGSLDGVFDGRIASLPLVDTGPLARGTVRLDAPQGLFGLRYLRREGFFESPEGREALSMAIDRASLLEPFSIGGWIPSSRIVPAALAPVPFPTSERWPNRTLEQRRAEAARRVSAWSGANGEPVTARIKLPSGPGSDILFDRIAADLQTVGIAARRAGDGEPADLELVDVVARYVSPRWYLNQFHCSLRRGLCSPEADALVVEALGIIDPAAQNVLLAEAAARLVETEVYVPFGPPVRWSLIRGDLTGFVENGWGLHPLFPMAQRPI